MSAAAQSTLLFIPDISGFTQFVNDTEITHSQHIIEELLEVLIDANELGLTVSEIEGDAILFYRGGQAPVMEALLSQVRHMYIGFHAHLRRYDTHRICQCGACSTASGLALKVIAHYGEVSKNQVKDHSKLFGRDVILAHRLLKNAVPEHEYVLMTDALVAARTEGPENHEAAWAEPCAGEEQYDVGLVSYQYLPLAPLRPQVPAPKIADYSLPGATVQMIETEALIEAPIDLVFDVISDLSARHHWQVGLKGSDRLNHKIPQHGATHRCVVKDSEKDPFVRSHSFEATKDHITFTDTEQRQGWSMVFILREAGPEATRLKAHFFIEESPVKEWLFRLLLKKRALRDLDASFANLNAYCKDLLERGQTHPAQVVLQPARDEERA